MTAVRVSRAWLSLREAADAAARSVELVESVRRLLPAGPRRVIHDLGCGTGSMGRWLAPRLPGKQHWIMHDCDPDLLEHAAAGMVDVTEVAAPVTVETRPGDIAGLTAEDLAGASLATASALLDLLTADEIGRVAMACAGAGCPALLTVSVAGRVDLTPADPLDAEITAAFNSHQRRTTGGRTLLGPDAIDATLGAFTGCGAATTVHASPWRLGADGRGDVELMTEWFMGWVAAACQHQPDLAVPATAYVHRRLADMAECRLGAVVHHFDLFAQWE